MRLVLVLALLGQLSGLSAEAARPRPGSQQARRVLRLATGRVESVPLEAYVAAVVSSEMGGGAPLAALEAQAIAARSFAMARDGRHAADGADLCDSTHCQVFAGVTRATASTLQAARKTEGLVLVRDGRILSAPFHSVCGGATASAREVWTAPDTPDLEGVPDDACPGTEGARWTLFLTRDEVTRIGERLGVEGARFLEVYARNGDGRVASVRLVNKHGELAVARGFDFRAVASSLLGWDSVRSTAFWVSELPKGYLLTGRGTGHGSGLCQRGAIERARRGESAAAILGHYYRKTTVARWETVRGKR